MSDMLNHHPDRIPLDRLPTRHQTLQTDRLRSRPLLSVVTPEPRTERHHALQAEAMQIDEAHTRPMWAEDTMPGDADQPRPGRHRCTPASADRLAFVLVGGIVFGCAAGLGGWLLWVVCRAIARAVL